MLRNVWFRRIDNECVFQAYKSGRIYWAEHVVRMPYSNPAKNAFILEKCANVEWKPDYGRPTVLRNRKVQEKQKRKTDDELASSIRALG